MIVTKPPEEAKEKAFKTLKDIVDALYPDSPEMKKDYVRMSKSLRKTLRAFETILESPDFDNLKFNEDLDDVLEELDKTEEGTPEFQNAMENLGNLPRNSIAKLAESDNEQTRKAIETFKEEFSVFSDSFSYAFERLFRALMEPIGLEEIVPKFPKLKRTEDEG